MANLQAIRDTVAEQRIFLGRLFAAVILVLCASGVVVARLTQLQVIEHEHYADLSQGNRIRIEAAPPTRGLILDRNGNVLAQNLPAYQLEMIPEQVDDVDAALDALIEAGLVNGDARDDLVPVDAEHLELEIAVVLLHGLLGLHGDDVVVELARLLCCRRPRTRRRTGREGTRRGPARWR